MAKSKASKPSQRKRGWNYPRQGMGPIRRWLPSWRFIVGSIIALGALGIGLFAAAWVTTPVPEPEELALAESTTVYFSDGETAIGTLAEVNRTTVDTATLPEYVGLAVVASEDRRFYSNSGVDLIGITRALWNNIRGGETQGGSTLTQQYVENYYLGTTTSITGKVREAIIALKVDQSKSKDEILGDYLNTIYFGRGAYGIEAAAEAYFGVPAAELTLSQSALLAGIIPAPSAWDPAIDPDQAEQRWNHVLGAMVEEEFITQDERDAQVFPETIAPGGSDRFAGTNGYLLAMARDELISGDDAPFTEDQLNREGLSIVTTFDAGMQAAAVATIEGMPSDHDEFTKATLVSIDPATGGVRALYGGTDYLTETYNRATQAVYQGGSTFKPFTLIAALEQGIPLDQTYESYDNMEIDGVVIPNYDSQDRGRIDLVEATADSVNTVYVQLNRDATPEGQEVGQETVDAAITAGLPEDTLGLGPTLNNVLGNASPHAIDMANVFATYAAQGERHTAHVIDRVENSDGTIMYEGPDEGEQVFDEQVIADATYAMTQVTEPGATAPQVGQLGRPVAGKTGTSNDNKSASFAGYVPQLATVVALYAQGEDDTEQEITAFAGYREITGGSVPADLWLTYMQQVTADMPIEDFPERSAPSTPTAPVTTTPETVEIPDVTGRDEESARQLLEEAGFAVTVEIENSADVDFGYVIRTDPSGEAEFGSSVTIVISDGPEETQPPEPTQEPEPTTEEPEPTQPPEPTPEPTATPTPGGTPTAEAAADAAQVGDVAKQGDSN